MAAQLFINTICQPRYNRYLPKLNHWAERRDALEKAGNTEAGAAAQQRVSYYFEKMHERGCFGDNYRHNLLTQFGFCWHNDIHLGLLNQRDVMRPGEAAQFLRMLRKLVSYFETRLRKVKRVDGLSYGETVNYYRDKYARLQALLREAIARHENIDFSG